MKTNAIFLMATLSLSPAWAFGQDEVDKKGNPDRRPRPQRVPGGPRGDGPGQGQGPAPEMMARAMGMMARNLPILKALDLDGDGQLSPQEIENASKSLMKLDTDGNGALSLEEIQPEPGPWMNMLGGRPGPGGPGGLGGREGSPEMMARMFENRDRDGDGKLQGEEIPPPMRERIGMLDENGDGALDKSELEKGMARLRGGAANREERRGGDGVTPKRPPRGGNPPKDRKKDPGENKA